MIVTFLDGPLAGEEREVFASGVTVTLARREEVESGPVNRIVYTIHDDGTATLSGEQ